MLRSVQNELFPNYGEVWSERQYTASVTWEREGDLPPVGYSVRIYSHPETGESLVLSNSAERLGRLEAPLNPQRTGLSRVSVLEDRRGVLISYVGPEDLWVQ